MAQTARPETTEAERLLKAAQRFLEQRNFSKCSKYVRQAHLSDPTHPGPHQILAISTVLSASGTAATTNHYSILNLPSPTHNQNLIRTHFQNLSALLNPAQNPFALASQAHDLVLKAWSVLSNGSAKTRFDKSLKMGRHGGGAFWTMCPYCYYVYEYGNVYLDCCLRCQNVKCRKAYQALPLRSPPPPQEVVATGRYACNGFFPVGGENGWDPFAPASSSSSSHVVIGIPNQKMEEKDVGSKSENTKVGGETENNKKVVGAKVEKVEFGGGVEIKGKSGGEKCEANNDGFALGSLENGSGSNRKGMRRKQMVSRNSTKFLKKGVRAKRDETPPATEGVEGEEEKESDENSGGEMGGDQPSQAGASVEFFDEEDDIFVGLQDIEK